MPEEKEGREYCETNWVPYKPRVDYLGAKKVVEQEFEYIHKRREHHGIPARQEPPQFHQEDQQAAGEGETVVRPKDLTGIALSGGGIRSATFSLGVIQALAEKGVLKRFDYSSTVSGGGYIGSALTWLLSREWKDKKDRQVPMGLGQDDLPFGTHWRSMSGGGYQSYKKAILSFMRQHANYLRPGHGITLGSLIAVVLRGIFISLLVYLPMLILMFFLFHRGGFYESASWLWLKDFPPFFILAAAMGAAFMLASILYSLLMFLLLRAKEMRYELRRLFESGAKWFLYLGVAFIILGGLPYVDDWVNKLPHLRASGSEGKGWLATLLGTVSTLVGILSGLGIFAKSETRKKGWLSAGALAAIASLLLLFGLLLLSYQIAYWLYTNSETEWVIAGVVAALAVGAVTNLNYISIHRYYRDRLMETFMPDVTEVIQVEGADPAASDIADRVSLHEMCSGKHPLAPYHIINANIIVEESHIPKFQGRKGDNFILSPRYCGSNATGWRCTNEFMKGYMTLPTAMAISGAAVNPGAGCGGEGMTRQSLLSMLMTFLNIRLGYSAPNPDPDKQPRLPWHPNFLCPGFRDLFMRWRITEKSRFVQLSDGGHFENLGLYELLRRRLKLIVVCDGAADPNYTFSDLANAIEKAWVDFGAIVHVTAEQLQAMTPCRDEDHASDKNDKADPRAQKFAQKGYLMARIDYEAVKGSDESKGILLYLPTTFIHGLSADLYGYRKTHPEFPDEPTSDQFFDEKQFEAYRELGFQLAWRMLEDVEGAGKGKAGAGEEPLAGPEYGLHAALDMLKDIEKAIESKIGENSEERLRREAYQVLWMDHQQTWRQA